MKRNPVDLLVRKGSLQHGLKTTTTVVVGLLVGVGSAEYTLLSTYGPPAGATTLGTVALLIACVLPVLAAGKLFKVLSAMRQTGLLTDLILTPVNPLQLCDVLAGRAAVAAGLPCALFGVAPLLYPELQALVLPWLALVVLLTLSFTYLAAVHAVCRHLTGPVLLVSCAPLLVCHSPLWGQCVSLTLLAVAARTTLYLYLDRRSSLVDFGRDVRRRFQGFPRRRYGGQDANAIVYREMARAGTPTWGAILLLLAIGVKSAVPVVVGILLLRMACRCWRGVVQDRSCIEALALTGMRAQEYVDGLAWSAVRPDLLVLFATLALLCGSDIGVLAIATVVLAVPLLIYGILYAALSCRTWVHAMLHLYVWVLLFQVVIALPSILVSMAVGPTGAMAFVVLWVGSLYLMSLGALRGGAVLRAASIDALRTLAA